MLQSSAAVTDHTLVLRHLIRTEFVFRTYALSWISQPQRAWKKSRFDCSPNLHGRRDALIAHPTCMEEETL
ncbi:hypothetical protein BLNAU_14929 [Blattamonas nauphoetae]|uniref:Uncharacterized protein n=1 Tax=Blattamonas nauphoetae TaxID=2049346 RepID=A0ABQ9XHL3_9EUKA|nr:hypothetical protein BLNAU_14929 [Blattamonas nauphoetae]